VAALDSLIGDLFVVDTVPPTKFQFQGTVIKILRIDCETSLTILFALSFIIRYFWTIIPGSFVNRCLKSSGELSLLLL
jgi:hypothetical protein